MYQADPESEKKEIIKHYRNLLKVLKPKTGTNDKRLIRQAFDIAAEEHKDMRRKSGEPYIYHPIEVARICVEEIGLGTTSVICALLHDVVEDKEYPLEEIESQFGTKAMQIIDGLTKIKEISDNTSSAQLETLRKIILTLSDDIRVILIKLADRLHNMRTLDAMTESKQLKIASETTYLYSPLAHRLGLYAIKTELEDLSLKYTEPDIYRSISAKLKESQADRSRDIQAFILPIKKALGERGIVYSIITREKSVNSIWEKMKKKEIPFEEVYDLFAIRIILDLPEMEDLAEIRQKGDLKKAQEIERSIEKEECFRIYTIITNLYSPNPERFRDWISHPKANGYESLHTTVMGPAGRWVEVQIRTRRMHEIAEKGYAAHWKYKGNGSGDSGLDEWLNKVRELLSRNDSSAAELLSDFKYTLFSEEIYVYTPKGELKTIPSGSTVLDFAYNIHSKIGQKALGAKVNHKLVNLGYKLKSGDQVEVLTSRNDQVKSEWLDCVVTARAKSRIRAYLREEQKEMTEKGKQLLEEYFNENGIELIRPNIDKFLEYNKLKNIGELYARLSGGEIDAAAVKVFSQENEKRKWYSYIMPSFGKGKKPSPGKGHDLDEIEKSYSRPGEAVLEYKVSPCCNPIPGDDVVRYIPDGAPAQIHRTNCEEAIQLMARFGKDVNKFNWDNPEGIGFLTGLKIISIDKVGLVNDITKIISEKMNLKIKQVMFESLGEVAEGAIMLYVPGKTVLNDVIGQIKKIPGIKGVTRINHLA